MKFIKNIFLILICFLFTQTAFASTETKNNLSEKYLKELLAGNSRFSHNKLKHPQQTAESLKKLKAYQKPKAVIISCSDSRVPPELIFDQGIGSLFIIRTAGNIIGQYELGSVEYALEHLHTPLVIVLGHDNCGAVTAFVKEHENHNLEHGHIQDIINYIKTESEEKEYENLENIPVDLAIEANIKHGVNLLTNSEPIISELVKSQEVKITGAIINFDTGKIRLIK